MADLSCPGADLWPCLEAFRRFWNRAFGGHVCLHGSGGNEYGHYGQKRYGNFSLPALHPVCRGGNPDRGKGGFKAFGRDPILWGLALWKAGEGRASLVAGHRDRRVLFKLFHEAYFPGIFHRAVSFLLCLLCSLSLAGAKRDKRQDLPRGHMGDGVSSFGGSRGLGWDVDPHLPDDRRPHHLCIHFYMGKTGI